MDIKEPEHGIIEEKEAEGLTVMKCLVSSYYGIQKTRIAVGSEVNSVVKNYGDIVDDPTGQEQNVWTIKSKDQIVTYSVSDTTQLLLDLFLESEQIEKLILKNIRPMVKTYPIYTEWLKDVNGIAEIIAGGFISGIKTPARFDTISKLWKYCGQAPVNGQADKRKRGEKIHYSPFLKMTCWKAGESFVKSKGIYRDAYDTFRAHEDANNPVFLIPIGEATGRARADDPDLKPLITKDVDRLKKKGVTELEVRRSKGHNYARAKRKTVKLFLSHLWVVWRELEGLPTSDPYVHAILGHTNKIDPPEGAGAVSK